MGSLLQSGLGLSEYKTSDTFIETYSGNKFYPSSPVFNVKDIAHGLSLNCRFNGHVSQFYSVAEHSILVALLCRELALADPFEGLMHDAVEAYLSDVPSPIKALLPDWKLLEKSMESALRSQFGIPDPASPGIKHADILALFIEAYYLLPSKGEVFSDSLGLRPQALGLIEKQGWKLPLFDPNQAEKAFIAAFDETEKERKAALAKLNAR